MTASSRRGDTLAPTLFPFLAVLLCTMGALVLILMLLVAGAELSGKEVVKQFDEELQWEHEKIRLAKNELHDKYEEAKIELEKKRLVLQNYEQHIRELNDELEQLEKKALQTESDFDTNKDSQKNRDDQRQALEKQLAEAMKNREQKLADPKGDKPIFAIIPYDGPNGTHRRPIYLECTGSGVVVQPEGVVLTPVDLRPPYGPGNPLDAVLRAIRAEFPATNGAVTSNPYPLLVVRPSGIRHFMMARAAMSGWDDQFGYELVSEELELTFPASVPKLEQKIVDAIASARERQAALVLAMPRHYSADQLDSLEVYGESGATGGFADDSLDFGGTTSASNGESSQGLGARSSSGRGGIATEAGQLSVGTDFASKNAPQNFSASATNGQLATAPPSLSQSNPWGLGSSRQPQAFSPANGAGSLSFLGAGGSSNDSQSTDGHLAGTPSAGREKTSNSSSTSFNENGLADTNSSSGGSGTSSGTGQGTGSVASASRGSSGTASNGTTATSGGQSGNSVPAFGSSNASSVEASNDPSQAGGLSSLNMDISNQHSQAARPIAQSRGRGWAWRDGNRSQTSVIRAVRLQCYVDRWVLMPDRGSPEAPMIIPIDGSLVQHAESLAAAVTRRVEGWGVAVAGGHWAPVLHVDVASDAQLRFQQLQRLLEGSGIGIERKTTIAPQSR